MKVQFFLFRLRKNGRVVYCSGLLIRRRNYILTIGSNPIFSAKEGSALASQTVLKTAELTLLGIQLLYLPPARYSSKNRALGYELRGCRFDSY